MRALQVEGNAFVYAAALTLGHFVLLRLCLQEPSPERELLAAKAFIMRLVDAMLPASRLLQLTMAEETAFSGVCDVVMFRGNPRDAFVAALKGKWMAPAMVAMRHARGLADAVPEARSNMKRFQAHQREDVAANGLKTCALPSCDKREASVMQFKFCSACRSVWYCSEEHGGLHWKVHKPICRATTAAKLAAATTAE